MFYVDQLVLLLACLVCYEIMTVKNFVFRENCGGSEVAGMKITFFVIFDSTWTNIFVSKGPNMELFKQNFNFQSIRKTEAILLPVM